MILRKFALIFCLSSISTLGSSKSLTPGVSENTETVLNDEAKFDKPNICTTQACNNSAKWLKDYVDPNVDPCDNFYLFVCGKFLNNTVIPEDKTQVSTFGIIDDKLKNRLKKTMEEESKPTDLKTFRLAKTLYWSCMNETLIEERGLKPLFQVIEELGGWPVLLADKWDESNFNWTSTIYKLVELGLTADLLIDFEINIDTKNNSRHIIELDQAILGLSRKYLSQGRGEKYVEAYYNYMVEIAKILGADNKTASKQLEESLDFEIKLANISLPEEERRNDTTLYNLMTIRELKEKFPSISWLEYINTVLSMTTTATEDEPLIVNVPSFISQLENLLKETPKRVQANYILWRVVKSSVKSLDSKVREKELAYYSIIDGITKRKTRWRECLDLVSDELSIGVGALYVRKLFNEDAKNNAIQMVSNIKQEFKKILQKVEWMDNKTRSAALEKVDLMKINVAYPDELLNDKILEEYYEKLEISSEHFFESMLNITLFNREFALKKLRQPVNTSDWKNHADSAVVNAFYMPDENSIEFPAGILQGPYFSSDRPKYMNYGAMGSTIGHEITHGFDDQGSQYDKDGNLLDWWQPSTKEKYINLTQCIIDQYSNYSVPEIGLNLNGINTQGENVADNGGMKVAYLAYNMWANQHETEPKLQGFERFTSQQMFWISAANAECIKYRPEYLKRRVETGYHSPAEFRVLGPVTNIPQFAQDFNCKPGTKMNIKNKCSVW